MTPNQPTVADDSAAVAAMRPDWALAAALLGGTRAMRAAGEAYLPKWPNEPQKSYQSRLGTAVLFPAFARTVETLKGKPFSKIITPSDDMPPEVLAWLQDIDKEGRNITTFAGDVMSDLLGPGLSGILVDFPVVERNAAAVEADGQEPVRPLTQAEEKALGLRPYWIHVRPSSIRGWRVLRQGGSFKLMQLRIMECIEEEDGPYATKTVEQVRVLEPGTWETHRKNDKGEWMPYERGVTTVDFIPFVPCYGKRTGFMTAEPPLRDLAYMNVKHWQDSSDQSALMHIARVPILVRTGITAGMDGNGNPMSNELTIGAGVAIDLPNGATLEYVEHSGAAIGAGKQEIDDLEERMRQAGAELLVIKPGQVTATQTATENAVGMCALQAITLGEEDALNLALDYTAKMVKLPSAGKVSLFKDFGALTLEAASAQLLVTAQQGGLLSKETTIDELKRRGILSESVDATEEAERIEQQGPALGTMGLNDPTKPGGANQADPQVA